MIGGLGYCNFSTFNMVDILKYENTIERFKYRKNIKSNVKKEMFVVWGKN